MVGTRVSLRNAKLGPKSAKLDLKPRVEPAEGDDPEDLHGEGNGSRSLRKMSPQACATPAPRPHPTHPTHPSVAPPPLGRVGGRAAIIRTPSIRN